MGGGGVGLKGKGWAALIKPASSHRARGVGWRGWWTADTSVAGGSGGSSGCGGSGSPGGSGGSGGFGGEGHWLCRQLQPLC